MLETASAVDVPDSVTNASIYGFDVSCPRYSLQSTLLASKAVAFKIA